MPSPHFLRARDTWAHLKWVLLQRGWGWCLLDPQCQPGRLARGWGGGVCTGLSRRRGALRECPSLPPRAARPRLALALSRRISPQPALPLPLGECLLTHPEKVSIMARRLPPPEEFRGAGPAGRQGADRRELCDWLARRSSTPLRGWLATGSPPFPPPCWGEEARWPLPPRRPVRNAGPSSPFCPPEGSRAAEAGGEALASPRHWGRGWEETHLGRHKSRPDRWLENQSKTRAVSLPPLPRAPRSTGSTTPRKDLSAAAHDWPKPSPSGWHSHVARAPRCAHHRVHRGPPMTGAGGTQALPGTAPRAALERLGAPRSEARLSAGAGEKVAKFARCAHHDGASGFGHNR